MIAMKKLPKIDLMKFVFGKEKLDKWDFVEILVAIVLASLLTFILLHFYDII